MCMATARSPRALSAIVGRLSCLSIALGEEAGQDTVLKEPGAADPSGEIAADPRKGRQHPAQRSGLAPSP